MTAFETEPLESCHPLGRDPKDAFPPPRSLKAGRNAPRASASKSMTFLLRHRMPGGCHRLERQVPKDPPELWCEIHPTARGCLNLFSGNGSGFALLADEDDENSGR